MSSRALTIYTAVITTLAVLTFLPSIVMQVVVGVAIAVGLYVAVTFVALRTNRQRNPHVTDL